jgi:hypothetical protein
MNLSINAMLNFSDTTLKVILFFNKKPKDRSKRRIRSEKFMEILVML